MIDTYALINQRHKILKEQANINDVIQEMSKAHLNDSESKEPMVALLERQTSLFNKSVAIRAKIENAFATYQELGSKRIEIPETPKESEFLYDTKSS